MNVIVIEKTDPNSYHSVPTFKAVAKDITSAMQWIQAEVDGAFGSGNRYMQGQTADWWLANGWFKLREVQVY